MATGIKAEEMLKLGVLTIPNTDYNTFHLPSLMAMLYPQHKGVSANFSRRYRSMCPIKAKSHKVFYTLWDFLICFLICSLGAGNGI